MSGPDIEQLWLDAGKPGAHKFRQVLIRKGIPAPSEKYLNEYFLKYKSSKQLFAKGPRYLGKVWSPAVDSRWQCDVLVNTQKPSEYKGTKWEYALIVVDVFSRYLWAHLITSPKEAYVGFWAILEEAKKAPQVLSCDADAGFLSPQFKELLKFRGIEQSIRAGRNDLSVVDRAIYTLKRTQAVHTLDSGQNDWAARLGSIVKAYNDSPHGTLSDGAPDDLRGPDGEVKNKLLHFRREGEEIQNVRTKDRRAHV